MRRLAWLLMLAVLAACGAKRHCQSDPAYQEAREYPALKAPPGLVVPESDPNLAIPRLDDKVVAKQNPDACLEVPPQLTVESRPLPEAERSKP